VYPVSKITVFIEAAFEDEIAILISRAGLRIFTIFGFSIEKCGSGYDSHEFSKLVDSTFFEIESSPIFEWIPSVTPPVFLAINSEL
jgi:hypothetical protein